MASGLAWEVHGRHLADLVQLGLDLVQERVDLGLVVDVNLGEWRRVQPGR